MTRVLITGSDGFVGSHVVRTLDRTTWPLRLFDEHDRWSDVPPVDVVISLAATADPRQALRDPVAAYENNVRVMVETLEYARKVGARVLHVSTNEVYGTGATLPYRPRGPYAGGKACQEIICESYPDVSTTIVVTQSLFGERQQPDKLIPTAVRRLLAGEPIPLQGDGSQWASRPLLHVQNLAEALLWLCTREAGRRVHVGSDESLSLRDVIGILAHSLGCEPLVELVQAGGRAGHELNVESIGCDLEGWLHPYPARTALHDVARWYRDNPRWLEPHALPNLGATHSAPPREARRAA